MKLSFSWLKEYVPVSCSPDEFEEALTMSGLEIDGYEVISAQFQGVQVGRVLSVEKHPNADRLSLCKVESGEKNYQVVCGAPNVREGLLVPLAVPGAVLPGGFKIKKTKLRGVDSEGMICSSKELELSDDSAGIMELPGDLTSGADFSEVVNTEDTIFNVELTPNRGDCCSVLGLARETSAVFDLKMIKNRIVSEPLPVKHTSKIVSIKDTDDCPIYSAKIVKDVQIGPSPDWLKRRLESIGLRSINNVVDATNYVMMELGQPLHAFDYDTLEDRCICVRRAAKGEKITTIDEVERSLDESVLVIADSKKPVAIAGIMGGLHTEVTEKTVNILLESACFNPGRVRIGTKKTGLSTDASYRFERRIDPAGVLPALNYAAELILKLAGGNASENEVSSSKVFKPKCIPLRPLRVRQVLGLDIDENEIIALVERLGFKLTERNGESLKISVPTCRGDLTREIDLIEEIARLHGYNRINEESPLLRILHDRSIFSQTGKLARQTREILISLGLNEIVNYSFIGEELLKNAGLTCNDESGNIQIVNPVSEDQKIMRPSLLPGLLQTASRNAANGNSTVCCFELGRIFHSVSFGSNVKEKLSLGILITGNAWGSGWHEGFKTLDFYSLKGIIEELMQNIGLNNYEIKSGSQECFHPGRTAEIFCDNTKFGLLGEIHPGISDALRIHNPVLFAGIDFDFIADHCSREILFNEISRYPTVSRDLAILVDKNMKQSEVLNSIKEAGAVYLSKVSLFDVYAGKNIPDNKKSLAYSLLFQSNRGTLTDNKVETDMATIRGHLKKNIDCDFR